MEHNLSVDNIKSDIYKDRVSFLQKLVTLAEKADKKTHKKAAQAKTL
jgi:hypothetical protein